MLTTTPHQITKSKSPFISKIWYGNPQINLIEGTLTGTEITYSTSSSSSLPNEENLELIKQYIWDTNLNNKHLSSNKLCITNLKNKFSVNELIQLISTYLSYINTLRVFKCPSNNIYYLFIEFKNVEFCNIFYNTYNYSKLTPLESEYLLFNEITSLTFDEIYTTTEPQTQANDNDKNSLCSVEDAKICSICIETLERFDKGISSINSVNGVVYVLCGHAFHLECFIKLDDDKCPLCRYYLSPPNVSTCSLCTNEKDLWMCLVCGMISCGNEGNGSNHRVEHYKNTGHVYAQGIGANHKIIYDLTKGIPVHIMIYNSILTSYNKPKEQEIEEETEVITTASNINDNNNNNTDDNNQIATNEDEIVHKNPKEKTEFIISEYNSIISSQLENQRFYYRDKLKHLEDKKLLEQQLIESEIRNILHEIKTLDEKIAIAEQAKTAAFTNVKDKNIILDNINTQLKSSEEEYKLLSTEKTRLETYNAMATEDIDKEIKQQDTEIIELNQQIKDLHIHFNTVNTIGKRSDMKEFQNASIGMLLDIEGPKKSRHHKHKK